MKAVGRRVGAQASRFHASEAGATAIEYSVLMSILVLAIITGASVTGTNLSDLFNEVMLQVSAALAKS